MKMEMLSVQSQFQGQFGVIGSSKVKDWTSPLTPPPSSHKNNHRHNLKKYRDENDGSSKKAVGKSVSPSENSVAASKKSLATANARNLKTDSRYNNNIISYSLNDDNNDDTVTELSLRLQSELRAAKSRHLACTEVLLPDDLLPRISSEIIRVSEKEPCGIKGCTVFIEFEDEPSNTRRIASLKIDPNTVSTFELFLTIKHDKSGWHNILPQFLKNLARSSTIMISPDFTLTKNKLYHSFSE